MNSSWRIYATAGVVLLEVMHLTWEHFHGGVKSHHILNQPDLPAFSNLWGLLLLPALTLFLTHFIHQRIAPSGNIVPASTVPMVLFGFLASLLFGTLLSYSFVGSYEDLSAYLFFGMMLLALVFPLYRGEFLLGFVLGMTFTFGAVLPILIGGVIAALSAFVHLFVVSGIRRIWFGRRRSKQL